MGASGIGYRLGLSAWWWVGSAGIGTLILSLFVGPRLWRIAQANGLHTMGDYLELRYSKSVRGTIAVILWFGTLAILAAQLIAIAWILNVVAGPAEMGGVRGGRRGGDHVLHGGGAGVGGDREYRGAERDDDGLALCAVYSMHAAGGWSGLTASLVGANRGPCNGADELHRGGSEADPCLRRDSGAVLSFALPDWRRSSTARATQDRFASEWG